LFAEKRKRKRIREENKVKIKLITGNKPNSKEDIWYAHTKDLSLSGARILTEKKVPEENILKVDISLAETNKTFSAFGKVKWIKKARGSDLFEMGLEFTDARPKAIAILIGHIYKIK